MNEREQFQANLRANLNQPVAPQNSLRSVAANEEESKSILGTIADFGKEVFVRPPQEFGEALASRYSQDVADARKSIDNLKAIDPKAYEELHSIVGERASFKQVAGAGVEAGLTGLSFIPGVGWAARGASAVAKGEKAFKASKYLRASIEGGFWSAGFFAADAAKEDKEVGEILKQAGVGFGVGAAVSPAFVGAAGLVGKSLSLTKAGFNRVGQLIPENNLWSKLAETEQGKFFGRFFKRTSKILENDFNAKNIVDGIKNADRDTQLGMARIMDVFEDDFTLIANKKDFKIAEQAYLLGRGKADKFLDGLGDITPTNLLPDEQVLPETFFEKTIKNGGATLSIDGQPVTSGYSISPFKNREAIIDATVSLDKQMVEVSNYVRNNISVLKQNPNYKLGSWMSDGKIYLDIVVIENDLKTAMKMASDASQKAIFDLSKFATINVRDSITRQGLERGIVTGMKGTKRLEEAFSLKGVPLRVKYAGFQEKINAFYADFYEMAVSRKFNIKSVDPITGKVSWKRPPKAEELTSQYRAHVGADVDRLKNKTDIFGNLNTYRHFTIQQMVDNSIEGLTKWKFKTFEQAEAFLDEWVKFVKKNGRGMGKENILVKGMVSSGQAKNPDEAIKLLDLYRRNLSKVKLGSYLENERLFDFPIYNPFPDETLLTYAADSFKRIELVNNFGYKFTGNRVVMPEIEKAIERVRKSFGRGSDDVKEFNKFLNIALERVEKGTPAEKASLWLRTLSIPKLTFAQIVNVGQAPLNTLLVTDANVMFKGLIRSFSHVGRKEAMLTGATLESTIHDAMRASSGFDFGSWWLKKTGFVFTEWWNRTVAANGFKMWTEKNFARLLKNQNDDFARITLQELGINVDRALQRGKLTDFELLKAMQIGVEKTQFKSRPIDLPYWASSPIGKVFWQFKNFSYQQTTLIKDELSKQIAQGDYRRTARMLLILSTVFPMTGEVLNDIRSLVNQSRRPTDALDRYLQNLAMSGAWGMLGDMMQSADYGSFEVASPTLSSISELGKHLLKGGKKALSGKSAEKDFENFIISALRAIGVGTPLANVMREKKPGKESTLETIQRLTQ